MIQGLRGCSSGLDCYGEVLVDDDQKASQNDSILKLGDTKEGLPGGNKQDMGHFEQDLKQILDKF